MSGFDTWIQVVATIVALLGVVVSWVYTARQQRRDARSAAASRRAAAEDRAAAAASAERAERASALSIDTLERIAAALERMAPIAPHGSAQAGHPRADVSAHSETVPGIAAAVPTVAWRLVAGTGGHGTLHNEGPGAALDVRVSTDPTMPLLLGDAPAHVPAGGSLAFRVAPDARTRDRTVTVSWRSAPDAPVSRWRYPFLPADAGGASEPGAVVAALDD